MSAIEHENPWIAKHIQVETDFCEGNWRMAQRLVYIEYNGAPTAIPCPHEGCEAKTYWKSTIGAYKCPECDGLASHSGHVFGRRTQ